MVASRLVSALLTGKSSSSTSCRRRPFPALVPFLIWLLVSSALPVSGQTQPSKEYIRLGGRVIAIENSAPLTIVSLSPALPGSGLGGTFTIVALDQAGGGNITVVQFLVSPNVLHGNSSACHVMYMRDANLLALDSDGGGYNWAGYAAVGSGGSTLTNSQCSINTAGASVSVNGNYLTVNIPVQFMSGWSGAHYVFLSASNPSGNIPGDWSYYGTWTVQ